MNLDAMTVVVTGAGGALGRVVVARARALGGTVHALDLGFAADAPTSGAASGNRHTVDLTDAAATRRCFDELDRVDAVFNLAGGFAMGPKVHELTDEDWDAMFRINVMTLRNVARAVVPGMIARGRGSIVNVGAFGALKGGAGVGAYAAAKGAVMRLTESMDAELRGSGINVNAVLPSIIDTARNRADMPNADFSKWVSPDDLANVICFLGSDAARAVHGALVPVVGLS